MSAEDSVSKPVAAISVPNARRSRPIQLVLVIAGWVLSAALIVQVALWVVAPTTWPAALLPARWALDGGLVTVAGVIVGVLLVAVCVRGTVGLLRAAGLHQFSAVPAAQSMVTDPPLA